MPFGSSRTHTTTAPRRSGGLFSRREPAYGMRTTRTTKATPRSGGLFSRSKPAYGTRSTGSTKTAPRSGGLFSRSKPVHGTRTTATTTRGIGHTGHTAPVRHQKRHAGIGDKISGAMLRLKGTITGRPGEKAAGTRRMDGTDGRGSRRGSMLRTRSRF
ncbi:hypothetical protein DL763_003324 [Monosporascus cannonballus]|nr:hypothetical protein DL763_003324 [Monosporascus cannonballus]